MKKINEQNSENAVTMIIMGVSFNKVMNMCKSLNDLKIGHALPFTVVRTMTGK